MKKDLVFSQNTDDFIQFLKDDNVYIDKSLFIKHILTSKNHTIITCPRRWGKSLNLSMLRHFLKADGDNPKHYLNGVYDFNRGNKNKSYFEKLKIADEICEDGTTFIDTFQGKFPVIFLNLKSVQETYEQTFDQSLRFSISNTYQGHGYLYKKKLIDHLVLEEENKRGELEEMKIQILEILIIKQKIQFTDEMNTLRSYYNGKGEQPLINIDEFDKPVNNILSTTNNLTKEIIIKAKEFYQKIFDVLTPCSKGDPFIQQIIMTGILNSKMLEISTPLNNACKEGIITGQLVNYYGFDNEEINCLLDTTFNFKNDEQKDKLFYNLKQWYNGLVIGDDKQVFTPSSVMKILQDLNSYKNNMDCIRPTFQSYWSKTVTINVIRNFVEMSMKNRNYDALFEKLVKLSLHQKVDFNFDLTTYSLFSNLETSDDQFEELIFHYLLRQGYLTKVPYQTNKYQIPTKEVEIDYTNNVIPLLRITFFNDDEDNKNQFFKEVKNINFIKYDQVQVDSAVTRALQHVVIKYPNINEECFRIILDDVIENSEKKYYFKDVEGKYESGRSDLIYYYADCVNLYELRINDNKQEDKLEEAERHIYCQNYMNRILQSATTKKLQNIKKIKLIPVLMYRKGNILPWEYKTGNIHVHSIEDAKLIAIKIDQFDRQIKNENNQSLKNEFIDLLMGKQKPQQINTKQKNNQMEDENDSISIQSQELAQELKNQGINKDTLKLAQKIKLNNFFRTDVTEADLKEAKIGLGEEYAPKAVNAIQNIICAKQKKLREKHRKNALKKTFDHNRVKQSDKSKEC